MIKKHSVLIGISIGTFLMIVSTFYYPGGTYGHINSDGYDWENNYLSHLLGPLAVNGEENTARPIASVGVLFLTAGFGLFFVNFSSKIKIRSASLIIKYEWGPVIRIRILPRFNHLQLCCP